MHVQANFLALCVFELSVLEVAATLSAELCRLMTDFRIFLTTAVLNAFLHVKEVVEYKIFYNMTYI